MPEVSLPMTLALALLVLANVIAMFPSPKRKHWPAAYGLMAVGFPLLVWLIVEDGWLAGAVFVVAGASVLRWPVRYLVRWIRRVVQRRPMEEAP